jgi:hypothetical protein
MSKMQDESICIESGYAAITKFAQMLYTTCGNSLFEGYFNGGSFDFISNKICVYKNEIEKLAQLIEDYAVAYDDLKSNDFVNLAYEINYTLIDFFSKKMKTEILENLDKFSTSNEIVETLSLCYIDYAKLIYFDSSKKSPLKSIIKPVYSRLTNSFIQTLEDIKNTDNSRLNTTQKSLLSTIKNLSIEEVSCIEEAIYDTAKSNYGLISYKDCEIHPVDYLNGKEIFTIEDNNKYNYIRNKLKYDKPDLIFPENIKISINKENYKTTEANVKE